MTGGSDIGRACCAMMAVGNVGDGDVGLEEGCKTGGLFGGDGNDCVCLRGVFEGKIVEWVCGGDDFFDNGVDGRVIWVGEEDRTGVGGEGVCEGRTIGFLVGTGALMAFDYVGGVVGDMDEAYEAMLGLIAEGLGVDVERWVGCFDKLGGRLEVF